MEDDDDIGPLGIKKGTKRSKDFYEKVLPKELSCKGYSGYVYEIQTSLESEARHLKNDPYKHQDHQEKVGILLGDQLPRYDQCSLLTQILEKDWPKSNENHAFFLNCILEIYILRYQKSLLV